MSVAVPTKREAAVARKAARKAALADTRQGAKPTMAWGQALRQKVSPSAVWVLDRRPME